MSNPQAIIVPEMEPEQTSDVHIANFKNPFELSWFIHQTITNIPEASVGWLVAQGWQITDTSKDDSTTPATISYAMARQSLQNWQILLSLLNNYTTAWDTAKEMNEYRYNEIVTNWDKMLDSNQVHFNSQTDQQNALVDLFLGDLDEYMTAVEALVTANETSMSGAVDAAMGLVDDANNLMTLHGSDYDALVDLLLEDYTDYVTDFSAILNLLPDDYDTHAGLARGFLTDLGATELARINEHFQETLATQSQQLTDRGLYSSAVYTDITARNTRDKNEEIAALNDRLNREKLDNQHKLFEQQVSMRGRTMEGKDRLYDRQQSMRRGTMEGKDRLYGLKQELLKYRVAQELQNAEAIVEHKHKAVVELMNTYQARLAGLQGMHADNMKLMAYQLDERNKALIGLYGFVERREDAYPEFSELTKICTSLGDAGGGWVSP